MKYGFRRPEFLIALTFVAILASSTGREAPLPEHPLPCISPTPALAQVKPPSQEPATDDVPARPNEERFVLTSKPMDVRDLSFTVSVVGKNAEFHLTNRGTSPHSYFDSLELNSAGLPRHTWIQVLTEEGQLYDDWPISAGDWSPNYVSNCLSDIATRLPADLKTIDAGETRSLILPIDEFFERSGFDREVQGYRVRVVSLLYLNADFTKRIRSQSDWSPLEF